jgi:hypothetical protein
MYTCIFYRKDVKERKKDAKDAKEGMLRKEGRMEGC